MSAPWTQHHAQQELFALATFKRLRGGDASSRFDNVVIAVSGAMAGTLVYAGAARLAGVQELHEAIQRLAGMVRRPAAE